MELRLAFFLALSLCACRPEIGDPCETSTDCSPNGDRLCDVTQKKHGGYCTVFNCQPGECPDEAVCVEFGGERSPLDGCEDPLGAGPYTRTYCLKKCKKNNDCREKDGYKCLNPHDAWGATWLDEHARICGIPPTGARTPKLNEDAGASDAGADDADAGDAAPDAGPPPRSNDVCTGDVTPSDDGMGGAGG